MSDTYVLVRGAWHTGAELEPTAEFIRAKGHTGHCPTLLGNRPGDDRASIGLEDAAQSLAAYLREHKLTQVRLADHSYGGMVISRVAELESARLVRLIYVNAFVPNPGDALNDLVPPSHVGMFDAIAAANSGAVTLLFPVWCEVFINDVDLALATSSYATLNPHPYKTMTAKIILSQPLAAMAVGKSYLNCQQDTSMPASLPWHPRLSERIGLIRLVECPGSHEIWFTNPATIADALIRAGRD